MLPSDVVVAGRHAGPFDQINLATEQLSHCILNGDHFEKPWGHARLEIDKEINVALVIEVLPCGGTEYRQPVNTIAPAHMR